MAAPGFYDDRDAAKPVLDQHQALMWEVGDLMGQWEMLQHREPITSPISRIRNSITILYFDLTRRLVIQIL